MNSLRAPALWLSLMSSAGTLPFFLFTLPAGVLAGIVLAVSYGLMAVVRQPQVFFIVAALAGAAWTISASELWIAGQRIIPDWIREAA